MSEHRLPERDRPWVMRTYAGHSDARRSNELYRKNLAKGQTGLSVAFTVNEIPKWNPINVCSYHLQEAGATPVQEVAYALSTAIAVLDEVKARGQVSDDDFPKVFGRISFFVNAGLRFIEEHAKLRAMSELWERIGRDRYGVGDPKLLR